MKSLTDNEPAFWMIATAMGAGCLAAAFWFGASGPGMFMVFGVLSIMVLGLRDVVSSSAKDAAHSDAMSLLAAELGLDYEPTTQSNVLGWSESFQLTREHDKVNAALDEHVNRDSWIGRIASIAVPKARHVMSRSEGNTQVALFDHRVAGSEQPILQAAAAIQSPSLTSEYFGLFPLSRGERLRSRFFESDEADSSHRLEGSLDDTVAQSLCEWLEPTATLEVGEGFLLLYHNDQLPLESRTPQVLLAELRAVYSVVQELLQPADCLAASC